jgi:hypothetical protein
MGAHSGDGLDGKHDFPIRLRREVLERFSRVARGYVKRSLLRLGGERPRREPEQREEQKQPRTKSRPTSGTIRGHGDRLSWDMAGVVAIQDALAARFR